MEAQPPAQAVWSEGMRSLALLVAPLDAGDEFLHGDRPVVVEVEKCEHGVTLGVGHGAAMPHREPELALAHAACAA